MKWYDLLILALVAGYCLYVLLRKNKPGCGGNCEHCNGCAGKKNKKA
ncbi:MAG: FeoB-associated Cys-rich membrane protein [Oscillospiraceae bacterium]|nr:FeoB-associated Cys-rich membrane protein [Oscillospiraceae bacterium]